MDLFGSSKVYELGFPGLPSDGGGASVICNMTSPAVIPYCSRNHWKHDGFPSLPGNDLIITNGMGLGHVSIIKFS